MYNSRQTFSSNRSFQSPRNRPGQYGGSARFSHGRGGGGGNRRSKLEGRDPSIFIKKAAGFDGAEVQEYTPVNTFSDFALADSIKDNIAKNNYIHPTPIQDQAIPAILEGRDVIGVANTGTGKTAAFLLPIINKIVNDPSQGALIIAPTRELAVQIQEELNKFSQGLRISSSLVIGGANMQRQISDIKRAPHFVIGTPGRLKDLIQQRVLFLEDYSTFVLDEVDMMVDIGFLVDVKYFISLLPKVRQSLFFSATIPPKVGELLNTFVNDPVTITIKKQDTSENVDQDIIKVKDKSKKVEQLHDLLITEGFDKVLIFGRTKHGIDKLHKELEFRGFKAGLIHGNKNQAQRQKALSKFKANETQILLATDVASRGLDIPNVTHVINYDLPENFEDYIHRIGRTGRANNKGTALTFID